MATEDPFRTDNPGIGDLESEQLYLEVTKDEYPYKNSTLRSIFLQGGKHLTETPNG